MPAFDPDDALTTEELYAGLATDLVEQYAPAPVPLPDPDTYTDRKARAQQLVYDWLTQTGGGIVSSKSISGAVSKSFAGDAGRQVRNIIRETMSEFYAGPTGNANKAFISAFPY